MEKRDQLRRSLVIIGLLLALPACGPGFKAKPDEKGARVIGAQIPLQNQKPRDSAPTVETPEPQQSDQSQQQELPPVQMPSPTDAPEPVEQVIPLPQTLPARGSEGNSQQPPASSQQSGSETVQPGAPQPAAPRPAAPQPVPAVNTPSTRQPPARSQAPDRPTQPAHNDNGQVTRLATDEIVEVGSIRPTIYFFPVFNEDQPRCDAAQKVGMRGVDGVLAHVCPKTLELCGLQGSCGVVQNGKLTSYNIKDRVNGQDRFFIIDNNNCRFGYGVRMMCLDPFYTLAADLDLYSPGDVIYIPGVVGLALPDGSKHDGFFVIRDQGRDIKGKGRFDFFSGYFNWNNGSNPFAKIGLSSVSTNIPYYKIKGDRAKRVLERRGFPNLPARPISVRPQ